MMQDGLHIGLAAWINGQRNTDSFPVYPAMPFVTELVDLQDIQNLTQAWEFARLVNFVPRQGQVADTFSSSAVLWRVHRDILGQMDHATEAWTSEEQAEYQAARDILYTTDDAGRPVPSQTYALYKVMKEAYEDLSTSGGSSDEIREAMSNWLVLGHKNLVEDAFGDMLRLSGRSSRVQVQNESLLLMEDVGVGLRFYNDTSFAPVYFAPISAVARETWMEAEVSFADLDRAVGNSPPNDRWKEYRANRAGKVSFDYVVLTCLRPWYTPALYQADDWKLSTDDTMVSKGNGTEGLLPAYVDAVYLVSVKNVTTNPKPRRPKPKPRSTLRPFGTTNIVRAELFQPSLRRKSPDDAGPSVGIAKKAVNTPMAMRTMSTSTRSSPPRSVSRVSTSTTASSRFTALNLGKVRRMTAVDLNRRYTVAQAYLAGTTWTPPTPAEETTPTQIHVAGFGCEKIPFAPNPNVNYRWT